MSISLSAHTEHRTTFKVVVVGERAVGKTSMAIRYIKGVFHKLYAVTVGIQFYSKVIEEKGEEYNLQIWDTAGQESFRSLIRSFYNQASCIIIAYSQPSEMVKSVGSYRREVEDYASGQALVFVARTKIDLKQVEEQEKVKLQQMEEEGKIDGWMEVSSKDGVNIQEFFQMVSSSLVRKYQESQTFRNLVCAKKLNKSFSLSKLDSPKSTQEQTIQIMPKKKRCCE